MSSTYEEVGAAIGVTKSAARKIEQRALWKVRKALEARGYDIDDVRELFQLLEADDLVANVEAPWDTEE